MSEDCLVLNVWTPSAGGAGKPVLVYLHGGGWALGSGSWPAYDGAPLARRGSVVVTLNHRLGILGHLSVAHRYSERFASSGNAGILDIVQALQWISANVSSFGGDPKRITVFGQSGGGYKLPTLLAMPTARSLIHRAVVISGTALGAQDPGAAADRADRALHVLAVPERDEPRDVQSLPVAQLLEAVRTLAGGTRGILDAGFEPVLQDAVLPDRPADALASGASAGIPLIVGTTRHEALTLLPPQASSLTGPADVVRFLAPLVGADAQPVLAEYQDSCPGAELTDIAVAILTDYRSRIDSVRLAQARLHDPGTPTFMYEFSWESRRMRAAHGVDVPLWFDNPQAAEVTRDEPQAQGIASVMSRTLIEFAERGDPSHPGLPRWLPYTEHGRETMRFDRVPRLEAGRAVPASWTTRPTRSDNGN
jgi:para-nitrobenzyl esterase